MNKQNDIRFRWKWRRSGAMKGEYSLQEMAAAVELFANGVSATGNQLSHAEVLAHIGHPADPTNKVLWGWGAELESKGQHPLY